MHWAFLRTLRGRLLVLIGAGFGAVIVAMVFTNLQLRHLGASLTLVNRVYLPLASVTARLARPLDDTPSNREVLAQLVAEAEGLLVAAPQAPAPEDAAALDAARRQVADVRLAMDTWAAADAAGRPPARALLREEILQLDAFVDGRISNVAERTGRSQLLAERLAGALILSSLLLAGGVLYGVGSALSPVTRLTSEVRRLGGIAGPVAQPGDDEIATLGRALALMAAAVDERDRSLSAVSLHLRRVLDSLASAVVVEEAGLVTLSNPAARALWEVENGGQLPAWVAALPEGRHAALAVPTDPGAFQDVVVRPFGGEGRILVAEDCTERERARERLQRSERLALIGQMLAQVTHEVRNPLNAMSLHAELLEDEVHSHEGRAVLARVTAEIRRLEDVTERYLDLARRRPAELQPEDPVELARAVVALEEEALRRREVSARVEGEPGQLVEIEGNTLRRTLLNLIRNATEAGAHELHIRVTLAEGWLECLVEDDGPGMSPEVLARAFEPFYSTRAQGTGLGLAIVRQSIEDLGGTITAESGPGRGSRFRVRLPVLAPAA